ncbi:MAG TPA: hypothetical protein PK961_14675 [bacterium]|nr:hypothetical protein [bacterium]
MRKFCVFSMLLLLYLTLLPIVAAAGEIPDVPPGLNLPPFLGQPMQANPLPPKDVAPHPYLAPQSSMHVDMYNSGVVDLPAPLGLDPVVRSRSMSQFIGMCLNFFYDSNENLFAFCGTMPEGLLGLSIDFQIALIDPETLSKRATFALLSFSVLELLNIPLEFGYMNLDNLGRMIVIDDDNNVLFVGLIGDSAQPELAVLDSFALAGSVDPADDKVASVVPDYDGNYWFMTLGKTDADGKALVPAMLGVVVRDTQEVLLRELSGQVIENGLAIDAQGVYLVTDYATYGFTLDANAGKIDLLWREPYARATTPKPGTISLYGSGATPTLLGDDYLVITDNADEQINLLVYDRRSNVDGERLICRVPLFEAGASANENSVVAVGRSILVQNWYNAPSMIFGDHTQMAPGLWRIDIREDESGCDVVWRNEQFAAAGTIKLSTATGLIYGAMQSREIAGTRAWYAQAVDFVTGETVYQVLLGNGLFKDLLYIPVYFGPDGTLYQPVLNGIIAVSDTVQIDDDDDDDDASPDDDATDDDDEFLPPTSDDDDDDDDDGCGC